MTSTPARQDRGPPASAIWHQYKDWAYLLEAQFSAFKRILLYLLSTSLEKEFQSLNIPYPIPKSGGSRKQFCNNISFDIFLKCFKERIIFGLHFCRFTFH